EDRRAARCVGRARGGRLGRSSRERSFLRCGRRGGRRRGVDHRSHLSSGRGRAGRPIRDARPRGDHPEARRMIDASAPRRVLMTTDTAGGVWTYTLELACSLVARGARVLLAACGPSIDLARREELSRLEGVEVAAREFRLEWMDDPWDDVDASGKWLLDLVARFRPCDIHPHGFPQPEHPTRSHSITG